MVLIISDLEISFDESISDIKIIVERAKGEKCQRCWKYDPYVEKDPDKICKRCREIIGN